MRQCSWLEHLHNWGRSHWVMKDRSHPVLPILSSSPCFQQTGKYFHGAQACRNQQATLGQYRDRPKKQVDPSSAGIQRLESARTSLRFLQPRLTSLRMKAQSHAQCVTLPSGRHAQNLASRATLGKQRSCVHHWPLRPCPLEACTASCTCRELALTDACQGAFLDPSSAICTLYQDAPKPRHAQDVPELPPEQQSRVS